MDNDKARPEVDHVVEHIATEMIVQRKRRFNIAKHGQKHSEVDLQRYYEQWGDNLVFWLWTSKIKNRQMFVKECIGRLFKSKIWDQKNGRGMAILNKEIVAENAR